MISQTTIRPSMSSSEKTFEDSFEKKEFDNISKFLWCNHRATWKCKNDVLNKSLLRTVRKFFFIRVHHYHPQPRFRNKIKRMKYFDLTLRRVWENERIDAIFPNERSLFPRLCQTIHTHSATPILRSRDTLNAEQKDSSLNIEPLHQYVGFMANPKLMEGSNKLSEVYVDESLLKFMHLYHLCCRSYSNSMFETLCENKHFRIVFEIFISNITDWDILKLTNFSKNQDLFSEAIYEMSEKLGIKM